MKQIGARQEAGRIGGIGSCGRELCCASWITNFVSVTTNAARYQEISLNPQKLAGQCGKLKCCLNYEVHCYIDAQKDFPDKNIILETGKGPAYHTKTDIYRRIMWYGYEQGEEAINKLIPVPVERVVEIIEANKKGIKVADIIQYNEKRESETSDM
jgi:cell fate regulator YaaT (PSP1 superfamily)